MVVVLGVKQRRLLDFEQPSLLNVVIHNMFRSTAGTVLGTGQILELVRSWHWSDSCVLIICSRVAKLFWKMVVAISRAAAKLLCDR